MGEISITALIVIVVVVAAVFLWALVSRRPAFFESALFKIGLGMDRQGGGESDHGPVGDPESSNDLVPNMMEAILGAVANPVAELRMVAYVGNLELDALKQAPPENLQGARIRMLLKDPETSWQHMGDDSEQAAIRRREALDNVVATGRRQFDHLANDRTRSGGLDVVGWYQGDPVVRVVMVDPVAGDSTMFVGFYAVADRRGQKDYSGSGRPVLRVVDSALIDDFREWFDFNWWHCRRTED
jgi:hypothetical protein